MPLLPPPRFDLPVVGAYDSNREVKEAIQEEWDKITLEEIRARIRDMPRRCDLLVKTGGKAIKSAMW